MRRENPSLVLIFLLCTSRTVADYSSFFWPNSSDHHCPGMNYECGPPRLCAWNELLRLYFCCTPGDKDEVCHTWASPCDGGSNNVPSGAQTLCSNGENAFCCFKDSQKCTQSKDQINICWATAENPVALLNASLLNETYNSLVIASPSAASYPISIDALQRMTSTTALSSSSSTRTATLSVPSPITTISSTPPNTHTSLSGGTIGGIIVGVLGGIAIIGVVAFLLWWRKYRYAAAARVEYAQPNRHGTNGHFANSVELNSNMLPAEKGAGQGGYVGELPEQAVLEMSADTGRREY